MRIWHVVRLGFLCLMPWQVSDTLDIMGSPAAITEPTITAAGLAAGGLGTAAALTLAMGVFTSCEFTDVVDTAFAFAIGGAAIAGATTIAGYAL